MVLTNHDVAYCHASIWRPLQVVYNAPLVLCDRRSVRACDVLEADKVFPTKVDLDYLVKYNQDQKWYWLAGQQPDEVTLFKTWDSQCETEIAGMIYCL